MLILMKSKIKKYTISPLALSFWIPFLVLIGYFAYRKMAPFGSNSILTVDLGQQYIDQFAAFKYTILQHPSSFFYSFSNALGGDMLGEWAYYLMSPFNFIFLFVSNANLPAAILLVICLKISAAGLSMGYLLKKLHLQHGYYITLFAINFALSGWFVANNLNLLWLDTAVMLPLVIYQLEQVFYRQTWWRYSVLLAITIITNYYIGFMVAIFIVLYFLWRLTWPNVKHRLTILWHFALGSIIGGALSAWLILPTYFQLTLGKSQYNSEFSFKFDNNPLHLFLKLIPGSFDFDQMQSGQANFYVSAFILITLVTFITTRVIHWRVKVGAFAILSFLILATTWAPLTLLFHGFQYPVWYPYRFSFLISFFVIYLAAMSWQPTWRPQKITLVLLFVFLVGVAVYAFINDQKTSYTDSNSIAIFIGLALLTLAQFTFKSHDRIWLPILSLITIVSLGANVALTLNHFSYLTNTEYQNAIHALTDANQKIKKDRSWYRVAQTFQRTRGDSMMLNYYGGAHFSSALPKATPTFFGNFGQPDGDNYVVYSNGSVLSDAFLGMKYFITANGKDNGDAGQPSQHLIGFRPDSKKYNLKATTKTTNVYQNKNALPLAFAASSGALNTKMLFNNPLQNQGNLWQGITGSTTSTVHVDNFQKSIGHNITAPSMITGSIITRQNAAKPASLDLQFTPTNNDSYYLTIGSGLDIKNFDLLINGKIITQFNTYRHTVVVNLATNAKDKLQTITFRLKDTQTLALTNVTLYHIDNERIANDSTNLKQNGLKISKRSQRRIEGTIKTTTKKPLVMTTIPSIPGWQVKVDGKTVKTTKVANYFIAVKTKPGLHKISFVYTPPLFYYGVIISLLALLLLLIINRKSIAKKIHT